jgi:hypothetical protein
MRFAVDFWDWLFGEKVFLELPSGRTRRVSKRWLEKMEKEGKARQINGEVIKVHILDPYADLPSVLNLGSEKIGHYRVENWVVGEHIESEVVKKFKDPETGNLYVLFTVKEGFAEPRCMVLRKSVWETAKSKMDQIDEAE